MYKGRLVGLREFRQADLLPMHRWVNDERLNKYLAFATFPRSLEQTRNFLEAQLAPGARHEVNFVVYRLEDEAQEYVGSVGLKNIDWVHGNAELHAGLSAVEHLGKGFGTDSIRLLLRYAFDRLNLQKVWLQVVDFNAGGRKAYENAGFRVDGVMRSHFLYCNERHDLLVMSILRQEYYEANPQQR